MSHKSLMGDANVLKLSNEESNKITIERLEQALIILMEQKSFDSITITEMVKKAGVSRTAFYRNYNTKDDIIERFWRVSADTVYNLMGVDNLSNNECEYWLTMFKALEGHKKSLRILFKAGFFERLEYGLYERIVADAPNKSEEEKCYSHFWSGAVISALKFWVIESVDSTPEEMAEYVSIAYQENK